MQPADALWHSLLAFSVILLLAFGLCIPIGAEEFTFVYDQHYARSRIESFCHGEQHIVQYRRYGRTVTEQTTLHPCTDEHTPDDYSSYLVLDVSCHRPFVVVTIVNTEHVQGTQRSYSPRSPYLVRIGGERHQVDSGDLIQIREDRPDLLVDLQAKGEYDVSISSRYGESPQKVCGQGQVCAPIVQPVDGTVTYWPNAGNRFFFEIPKKPLWEVLKARQRQADRYDGGESTQPEQGMMNLRLHPVHNPATNQPLTTLDGTTGRWGTEALAATDQFFLAFARVSKDVGGVTVIKKAEPEFTSGKPLPPMLPRRHRYELERLQDYYNSCTNTVPTEQANTITLTSTARAAQTAVKSLAATPEWDDYRDLTLDEFEQVEDD